MPPLQGCLPGLEASVCWPCLCSFSSWSLAASGVKSLYGSAFWSLCLFACGTFSSFYITIYSTVTGNGVRPKVSTMVDARGSRPRSALRLPEVNRMHQINAPRVEARRQERESIGTVGQGRTQDCTGDCCQSRRRTSQCRCRCKTEAEASELQTQPLQRSTQRVHPAVLRCALKRRRHSPARSTCAAAPTPEFTLLATRRRHGGQVQEHVCRHAHHARAAGLDAADHLLCEVAVCTRLGD